MTPIYRIHCANKPRYPETLMRWVELAAFFVMGWAAASYLDMLKRWIG